MVEVGLLGLLSDVDAPLLVDRSTETGSTADPLVVQFDDGLIGSRRAKVQGPVGPCSVVVGDVLGQHDPGVPVTDDEHAVGDLAPNRSHPALRKRVRPWTTGWDLHRRDDNIGAQRVKGIGEHLLGVSKTPGRLRRSQ